VQRCVLAHHELTFCALRLAASWRQLQLPLGDQRSGRAFARDAQFRAQVADLVLRLAIVACARRSLAGVIV